MVMNAHAACLTVTISVANGFGSADKAPLAAQYQRPACNMTRL